MHRLTPWLTRSRLAYLGVALVLAALGWRMLAAGSARSGAAVPATAVSPMVTMPAPPAAPGPMVHVVGAVRHPGVYRLAEGARAQAALRRAGGPTQAADLSAVNLAAPLTDGQQLVVPTRGAPQTASPAGAGGGGDGPVHLSTATVEQLDTLDGIGPTLARRIVEWRTAHGGFTTVDQLQDVPGIGETRLEALRAKVVP